MLEARPSKLLLEVGGGHHREGLGDVRFVPQLEQECVELVDARELQFEDQVVLSRDAKGLLDVGVCKERRTQFFRGGEEEKDDEALADGAAVELESEAFDDAIGLEPLETCVGGGRPDVKAARQGLDGLAAVLAERPNQAAVKL